jgi:hypothetical protein
MALHPVSARTQIPILPNVALGMGVDPAQRRSEQNDQGVDPAVRDLYEAAMSDPEKRQELEKLLGPNPLQALNGMDGDMAEMILQWLQSKQSERANSGRNLGKLNGGGMPNLGGAMPNLGGAMPNLGGNSPGGNSPGGNATSPGGQSRTPGGNEPPADPTASQRTREPDRTNQTRTDPGPAANVNTANFTGDDRQKAAFIDNYLRSRGSPAANTPPGSPTAGQMMVDAGRQHNVDPLALLSIAGQETVFGTRGVGMQKMLGVSAYDRNPRNVNPRFDGLRNQIYRGAETFARLRARGGATPNDNLATQLRAANRAGWATDPNWHNGVASHYRRIAAAIPS